MCFLEAEIACRPHPCSSDSLRNGTLDAGARGVLVFESWCLFALPGSLKSPVIFFRLDCNSPPRRDSSGALCLRGASPTIPFSELNLDNLSAVDVGGGVPDLTAFSGGADDLFL